MIHDGVAGPEQAGDGLGRIQRTASAYPDNNVELLVPVCSDSFIDQLRGRFAFNCQHFPAQSGGLQPGFYFLPVLAMLKVARASNYEGSLAMTGQKGGELCSHAMTKNDSGQARKVKGWDHGKRFLVVKSEVNYWLGCWSRQVKSGRFVDTLLKSLL
jgi:hypothetical protein